MVPEVGLVARADTDDLILTVKTGGIAYFQYRHLYPFGGNGIRAIQFSGKLGLFLKIEKICIYLMKLF